MDREEQSKSGYDFQTNPRSWTFTGEVRAVFRPKRWWFDRTPIAQQWIFEKQNARIGVVIENGRLIVQDPPAGE